MEQDPTPMTREHEKGDIYLDNHRYRVVPSGNVTDEMWKKYIQNQEPPEPDDEFEVI